MVESLVSRGFFCCIVDKYSSKKGIGVGNFLTSGVFTAAGYEWYLCYYPDGENFKDSAFVGVHLLLKTSSQVMAHYEISLFKPDGVASTIVESTDPFQGPGKGYLYTTFLEKDEIEKSYVGSGDTLRLMVTIKVQKQVGQYLQTRHLQRFGALLANGEGVDVTFDVGGEKFAAHRCVLAAQSPVFKAQLYGSMEEKSLEVIKIEEMDIQVFKALVYFIYEASLPWANDFEFYEGRYSMACNLLEAADRYALKELKLLCEYQLCSYISLSTAVNLLIIADRHSCNQLKNECLQFMLSPLVMRSLMLTDGFKTLGEGHPLMLEIFKMFVLNSLGIEKLENNLDDAEVQRAAIL